MNSDVLMDYVIRSVERAFRDIDPNFLIMVEDYLRVTRGEGLELAYHRPDEFKKALEELLGLYPARAVEMIFLKVLSEEIGREVPDDFVEAVNYVKGL
jgi:hypothetical protein